MIQDRRFIHIDRTASTNDAVKAMIAASEEPVYAVVSARTQTGGRGRLGRSFFSPPGGLYFSASFPLTGEETNLPCLTLIAGLCVCEALEALCGVAPAIKWPNDLYLNGKKLCGILCELVGGKTPSAVVGVGVNLTARDDEIPAELRGKMTSLAAEGVAAPAREELLKAAAERLDRAVYDERALADAAVAARCMAAVDRRSCLTGQTVSRAESGVVVTGVFTGVSPAGEAILRLPDGSERRVISGELTVQTATL